MGSRGNRCGCKDVHRIILIVGLKIDGTFTCFVRLAFQLFSYLVNNLGWILLPKLKYTFNN